MLSVTEKPEQIKQSATIDLNSSKGVKMQSTAKDVSSYLQEVPKERYETLEKLRRLCLDVLESYQESMDYGMPCYKKNSIAEVGFASQKHFIALYILKKDVLDAQRDSLKVKGVSLGKGCIRYSKPDKINFELVKKLLVGTVASTSEIC
jgi:uncharacterized protein YdhG (YjbR/CyaY superfamily)